MHHSPDSTAGNVQRVRFALLLTGVFMLIEVAGGIVSGSLALLADAGHMLADTLALALTAIAFRISRKPADTRRSYGYSRFQILAAFVNGLSLIVIVAWIVFEAVQRLISPPQVTGSTMLLVAALGLAVNVASFVILHGADQHNLNIRGALLHVAGDLLGSVATIAAAIVILATDWMPIDPMLSIVVAVLILKSAWRLVRRSAHILLEGVPDGFDTGKLRGRIIERIPQVGDIHHVHVWGLTPDQRMLTMHLVLQQEPTDTTLLVRQVKAILRDEFSIEHSTIELEVDNCADH